MNAREKVGLILFIYGVSIIFEFIDGNTIGQAAAFFIGLVSAVIGAMVFAYEKDKQP